MDFYSNFPSAIPLNKENLDYCFINDDETKAMNFYKGLLEAIKFFSKVNNKSFFHN